MTIAKLSFHWKSLTEKKLADLIASLDGVSQSDIMATMETKEEKETKDGKEIVKSISYKRKSVDVDIALPDWVDGIPSPVAKDAVKDVVANYIRAYFLDLFLPAPKELDWEQLEKDMASVGGGRRKLEFSEELLATVAASFGKYMADITGQPAVGDRIKESVVQKLSIASIQKHLNSADEDTMRRLKTRLLAWAAWLAEQDEEKAEEYSPVFEYLVKRLDVNIGKLTVTQINFKDII